MNTKPDDRERRLATILVADIVGYSHLMDVDEEGTYTALHVARSEVIEPGIAIHKGRIVKHTGDGFLAEFPTVLSAVRFAMAMQEQMGRLVKDVPENLRIKFRIGINLGDIIVDDDGDIFGDGVNIAARLETLGIPGGICISGSVYEAVHKKLKVKFEDLGEQKVKNITEKVHAYDVRWPGEGGTPEERALKPTAKPKALGLIAGGVMATIAIIGLILWQLYLSEPEVDEARAAAISVAVLPFSDLSAARDQEYFGDGMAEEILNILAGVKGLDVTSRTTAFSLKGKGLSIPEMADQLGVSYIVEGSIRSADNRVRITAQLIETETDTHLWSEAYDREMTDIFAIQDDISRSITNALQVELFGEGAIRENPTDNLKAYQLYLQGHHLILQRGVANLRLAIERLRQAVELDPDFALAWADLAVGTLLIPTYTTNVDQQFYLDRADFATDKALELDPDMAMAVAMKGFIAFQEKQWRGALGPMKRALEIEPKNETIWLWYCVQLASMGYLEEALVASGRAYEIAPTTGINAGWLGIVYSSMGQQEQAHRFVDEAISLGWGYAYSTKAELLIREGDFAGAKQAYHNYLKYFNEPENGLDIFVDALQDPALRPKARAVLGGYLQQRLYMSSLFGGALLGDASVLVEFLETVSNNAITESIFFTSPSYRKVYNDPVFKDHLRKIGLVEFWRENGWPDYCKPVGDDDFECD